MATARKSATKPRLRFDKVALRFVSDVQAALYDEVPNGKTLIFTITAPLCQPSKTAAALEEMIRTQMLSGLATSVITCEINGNRIRARIASAARGSLKVLGFVHSPDPGADRALIEEAASKL